MDNVKCKCLIIKYLALSQFELPLPLLPSASPLKGGENFRVAFSFFIFSPCRGECGNARAGEEGYGGSKKQNATQ